MRNLPLTFDYSTYSQKLGEDFANFCGLLKIYELYSEYQFIFSFFPETWIDGATNRKFYFTITLKSFEEANDYCVNEGAILFEPKAEDINKRVSDHANTIQGQSTQTGFFELALRDRNMQVSFFGSCFQNPEI